MEHREVLPFAGTGTVLLAVSLTLAACLGPAAGGSASESIPTAARTSSPLPAASPTIAAPVDLSTPAKADDTETLAPTASQTPLLTSTPLPTGTPLPTAQPRGQPTLGYFDSFLLLTATPATPVPTPSARIQLEEGVVNVLLLGTDQEVSNSFRTDTIIVLSINKHTGSVSMLSIPRDLYVYVPQWKMHRINTADNHGRSVNYPGGGPALLGQTLLYNFGIPIHYYARINFDGFMKVVDTLGGIDVPVSCQLDDYILKDPALDPDLAENWEAYTVPVGIQHMDGPNALLYARLRQSYKAYNYDLPRIGRNVDDFDRSRRQQQVLRAIYHKALSLDIVPRIPALFGEFSSIIETDMNLGDVLQFAPLAAQLGDINIKSRFISQWYTTPWQTPEGESVRLPNPERLPFLLSDTFFAPSTNQLERAGQKIEVINGTANPNWEILAVDRLTWAGFNAVAGQADGTQYEKTTLIDYTTSAKGSALNGLRQELKLRGSQVVAQPDASSPVHFRLDLGRDYDTCGS